MNWIIRELKQRNDSYYFPYFGKLSDIIIKERDSFDKTLRVIISCVTIEQLKIAKRYAYLYAKKFNPISEQISGLKMAIKEQERIIKLTKRQRHGTHK